MTQLRVTSGTAKNKKLKVPKVSGFRAVQEKAKLAIFSILGHERVQGATCLDLFSGSGNLGIEALSRGAIYCDFVDQSYESEKTIIENLRNTGLADKAVVHKQNAVKFAAETPTKYNIVFLDPFYEDTAQSFLFENLEDALAEGGVIVYLHAEGVDVQGIVKNTELKVLDERRFGSSVVSFLKLL